MRKYTSVPFKTRAERAEKIDKVDREKKKNGKRFWLLVLAILALLVLSGTILYIIKPQFLSFLTGPGGSAGIGKFIAPPKITLKVDSALPQEFKDQIQAYINQFPDNYQLLAEPTPIEVSEEATTGEESTTTPILTEQLQAEDLPTDLEIGYYSWNQAKTVEELKGLTLLTPVAYFKSLTDNLNLNQLASYQIYVYQDDEDLLKRFLEKKKIKYKGMVVLSEEDLEEAKTTLYKNLKRVDKNDQKKIGFLRFANLDPRFKVLSITKLNNLDLIKELASIKNLDSNSELNKTGGFYIDCKQGEDLSSKRIELADNLLNEIGLKEVESTTNTDSTITASEEVTEEVLEETTEESTSQTETPTENLEEDTQKDENSNLGGLEIKSLTDLNMTGVTAITRGAGAKTNASGDPAYMARRIDKFLKAADLTHISNEVSFAKGCAAQSGTMSFCSSPTYIKALELIGTDIVELTGNHNNDYGATNNASTIKTYKNKDWTYFGGGLNKTDAAKVRYIKTKGTTLAFIGFNYYDTIHGTAAVAGTNRAGANSYSATKLKEALKEAKEKADVIIVDFQYTECWAYSQGNTQCYRPIAGQRALFRKAIDNGADIVVGTQAHQPQTYEVYKGKSIFYGLGNLFFDQYQWLGTRQGLVLTHYFYKGKHISTKLTTTLYNTNLQPYVTSGYERERLLKALK